MKNPDLDKLDQVIAELHKFESIRYPENGELQEEIELSDGARADADWTLDVYGHAIEGADAEAAKAIEGVLK